MVLLLLNRVAEWPPLWEKAVEFGLPYRGRQLLRIKVFPFWFRGCDVGPTVELQWLEHWRLVYHGCFELILESLGKKPIAADLG